jgi:hypothetical protein
MATYMAVSEQRWRTKCLSSPSPTDSCANLHMKVNRTSQRVGTNLKWVLGGKEVRDGLDLNNRGDAAVPVYVGEAMQEKAVVGACGLELYGILHIVLISATAIIVVVQAAVLLQDGDEGLLGGQDEVLAVQVVLDERRKLLDHSDLSGGHRDWFGLDWIGLQKARGEPIRSAKNQRYAEGMQ